METMKIVRLGVIIFFLKVLLCGFAEGSSCTPGFEPKLLVFKVQQDQFHQGRRLGRVIFNTCDGRTRTYFQSSDKRFDVDTDGTVTLKSQVAFHESHKVFSVHAWDFNCVEHTVSVRVERVHQQEDHHMDPVMNISSPQLKAHATGAGENNDNRPVFTQNPFNGNVPEAAEKGHEFMTVTATDADDPDTDNAVIRYSIVKQEPELPKPNMFQINSVTGGIRVDSLGLDREKWSKYTLTVVAADLKGKGHQTTGTAIITVTDSNDNAPQFDQTSHTVSVPENKVGAEVAKLTVTDGDEEGSPAWSTKYHIISGDKGGFFNVSTGPSQLEGIITTVKPLDFEKNKQYILSVIVENNELFVGSLATSTATVTVNVEDVNEPPEFNPKEKVTSKPEDSSVDSELVSYTATDPDIGLEDTFCLQ